MKTLTTYNQAFLAYAFVVGVKLANVKSEPDGFCTYLLDDTDGVATKAFNSWRANEAIVNAKTYAAAFGTVKHITMECRKNNGVNENDHSKQPKA